MSRSDIFGGLGLDLVAIELGEGPIFQDGANRRRIADGGMLLGRLFNGTGILVVGRTIGWSSPVG
jgi:hypothetical protein